MNRGDESIWDTKRPVALLFSIAFGVAVFVTYATAFHVRPQALGALLCFFAGRFVSTFVHECGHAIAALVCRWRLILFVVRPIGFQIPNRNVAIIPRDFKTEMGGWVATVPRAPRADTERNWSIILASGPAASFLLAAFAAFGSVSFLRAFDSEAVAVTRIGLGLAVQSSYSCAFSLFSSGRPDNPSDGDQLRALRRAGSEYALNRPILWLTTLLTYKVRLSAVPEWLVSEARALATSSEDTARFVASLDIGQVLDSIPVDIVRARTLVDAYRERFGGDGWLAACDAYLAAIWEGNPERAKAALAELGVEPAVPQMSFAAEAAVAARLGETSRARSIVRDMRKAVRRASPFQDLTFRDIRRQIEGLLT